MASSSVKVSEFIVIRRSSESEKQSQKRPDTVAQIIMDKFKSIKMLKFADSF